MSATQRQKKGQSVSAGVYRIIKSWVSPSSKYLEKAESSPEPDNPNPLSGDTKAGATLYLHYLRISIINSTNTKHRIPPKKKQYFQAFLVYTRLFFCIVKKKKLSSVGGLNSFQALPHAHQHLIFGRHLALPR